MNRSPSYRLLGSTLFLLPLLVCCAAPVKAWTLAQMLAVKSPVVLIKDSSSGVVLDEVHRSWILQVAAVTQEMARVYEIPVPNTYIILRSEANAAAMLDEGDHPIIIVSDIEHRQSVSARSEVTPARDGPITQAKEVSARRPATRDSYVTSASAANWPFQRAWSPLIKSARTSTCFASGSTRSDPGGSKFWLMGQFTVSSVAGDSDAIGCGARGPLLVNEKRAHVLP
jgi:hypothetical protein